MRNDSLAVVDARLRVRGIEGLRIADAPVMPKVPRGNTNAAAIMIGEKAADLLLMRPSLAAEDPRPRHLNRQAGGVNRMPNVRVRRHSQAFAAFVKDLRGVDSGETEDRTSHAQKSSEYNVFSQSRSILTLSIFQLSPSRTSPYS